MKKILSLACIAVFGLSLSANAVSFLDKVDSSLDKADKQITNVLNKPAQEKARLDAKKKAKKSEIAKKKAAKEAKVKAEKEKYENLKKKQENKVKEKKKLWDKLFEW